MLEANWETLAEELVNAKDLRHFLEEMDVSEMKNKYGFTETIFHESSLS